MSSPMFFLVNFLIICTTSATKSEQIRFVEKVKCNAASNYSDEICNLCVQLSNASHKEGYDLRRHVEHGHIVFENNGSNYLSWRYDPKVVHNPENLSVSFNIWDSSLNMAFALPGCCGVSLSERRCRVFGCANGLTYASVSSKWGSVVKVYHLEAMKTCTPAGRPTVRYFHICGNATREWKKRYNCDCAVYDSYTGLLKPGNQSTEMDKNNSDAELWTTSYQVCIFSMKKGDVMDRGQLQDTSEAIDSDAFGRGVFYMSGFTGHNGTVFDTVLRRPVNCTLKEFKGDDMFNISSLDVAKYHQPHNNNSFTCLTLWPNGTQQFQTQGTHVKCMPKNATHQEMQKQKSEVYMKNMQASPTFDSAMSVFIPVLGAVAVIAVICITAFFLRKKYNKFMKEMKHVPEGLDAVMKETIYDFATRIQSFTDDEKEDCQAFDKEEKDRLFWLRHKEKEKCKNPSHVFIQSINEQRCECYSNRVAEHGDVTGNLSIGFSEIPVNTQFVENGSTALNGRVDCGTCLKSSGSSRSRRQENDSGCPPSITSGHGLDSDDDTPSTSSDDVSYCVRHVCSSVTSQNDVFTSSMTEKSGEINPNLSGGYWTKSDEVKSPDAVSHLSIDTGCGTDCDEDPSGFECREEKTNPLLAKTFFKDCEVTKNNCYFNSTQNSSPKVTENMHELGYLDKSLRVCSNHLNQINFSCVEAT